MGRSRKAGVTRRAGEVYGHGYAKFRERMFSPAFFGPSPPCFYCGHPISANCGEIEHIVSPHTDPRLAQDPSNVRPVHGANYQPSGRGPDRRCPTCLLPCNIVAAGKPAQNEPVPWSAKFIEAAQKRSLARQRALGRKADRVAAAEPERVSPGREW